MTQTDNIAAFPPVPPKQAAPVLAPPAPKPRPAVAVQLERCRALLEPSLDPKDTWADIERAVLTGEAQLWPGAEAAMVTQVLEQKHGRVLHVWIGGGRLEELQQLQPAVAAWGRAMGCNEATIEGRPGWGRMLKADGWAAAFTVFRRPL